MKELTLYNYSKKEKANVAITAALILKILLSVCEILICIATVIVCIITIREFKNQYPNTENIQACGRLEFNMKDTKSTCGTFACPVGDVGYGYCLIDGNEKSLYNFKLEYKKSTDKKFKVLKEDIYILGLNVKNEVEDFIVCNKSVYYDIKLTRKNLESEEITFAWDWCLR